MCKTGPCFAKENGTCASPQNKNKLFQAMRLGDLIQVTLLEQEPPEVIVISRSCMSAIIVIAGIISLIPYIFKMMVKKMIYI